MGTWQAQPDQVRNAVLAALDIGYRHLDCAEVYANENEIGLAIEESAIPRQELWITSKLWNNKHAPKNVEPACRQTLKALRTHYLDLYLIHWPVAFKLDEKTGETAVDRDGNVIYDESVTLEDTWKALEKLVDAGLVRAIGVSNFTISKIQQILKIARIKPVMNQVELHPYLPQNELKEFCERNEILLTAYAPFGSGKEPSLFEDQVLKKVAEKYKKTVPQVLVSWAVQRGTIVIPKSVNPERLQANFQDFEMDKEDMDEINNISKTTRHRFFATTEWKQWGCPDVFGERTLVN
ncbi:hypothetical protein SeLEV6574_g01248 [Synchytrium endobioticum]|uniref:NADP-dependent oxidoreductase domain-containing protein n=1 Tax=Synchytrium endobioticum TaxID=286115 RepID=A0A507DE95_9FUNG|nr:hypothetical protein SeLEV6574_g01248 [Synchytrium endobioticum]